MLEIKNKPMEISFDDKDLEELIFTGKNRKYKKLSKDKVFMKALVDVYNLSLIHISHVTAGCRLLCHQRNLKGYRVGGNAAKCGYKLGKIHIGKGAVSYTHLVEVHYTG